MSTDTKIEWSDKTWGVVLGCDKISGGCANCYAIRTAHRLGSNPNEKIQAAYAGLTVKTPAGNLNWSGLVRCLPERLRDPLGWKKPQRIFVNSQSDLFHEDVPFEFIDRVWAVMALCPQHTFQILTKRPERMQEYFHDWATRHKWGVAAREFRDEPNLIAGSDMGCVSSVCGVVAPLSNVWLGVSVENQDTADVRIPYLLQVPAAVRFLCCEPMLGSVDLQCVRYDNLVDIDCLSGDHGVYRPLKGRSEARIHWVICGGESGPGARPMHPDWARSLRDQCTAAGVSFFFKQWGECLPFEEDAQPPFWNDQAGGHHDGHGLNILDPETGDIGAGWHPDSETSDVAWKRVSKKKAGRLLDGRTWDEMPQVSP